jgi:hypothetical protein
LLQVFRKKNISSTRPVAEQIGTNKFDKSSDVEPPFAP